MWPVTLPRARNLEMQNMYNETSFLLPGFSPPALMPQNPQKRETSSAPANSVGDANRPYPCSMELPVGDAEATPAGQRAAASSEQEEPPSSPDGVITTSIRMSFHGSDSGDSRSTSPCAGSRNSSPVDRRSNGARKKSLMYADPIWARAVMDNPLLRSLGPAEEKYVKGAVKLLPVGAGEIVYNQEDIASEAYVVQSGVFEAVETTPTRGMRPLRELHESASFGMHEMLHGVLRECSVRCTEAGAVWVINKRVFDSKLKVCPTPPKALLERIKDMSIFDSLPPSQYPQLCRGGE